MANSAWNIQNFVKPLIHGFASQHELVLCCPDCETLDEFKHLRRKSLDQLEPETWNPVKEFRGMKQLSRILVDNQIDLAILFTIKPIIYSRGFNSSYPTKIISVVTGLGQTFLKNTLKSRLARQLFFKGLERAHAIVVQNQDDLQLITNTLSDQSKVSLIPGSGVDVDHFTSIQKDKEYDFVYLGRCIYEKGLNDLRLACQQLDVENIPFKLAIAGKWEPSNPRYLSERDWDSFTSLKGVDYLGELEDVHPVLANAQSMILPSYREGLSRALLEAMSMELPILVSRVPGCKTLVDENKNGWTFEAGNVNQMVECMKQLLSSHPTKTAEMGSHSRSLVLKNYAQSLIVEQYRQLVREVAG